MKIEVKYIGHSGFSVGVGSHFLLFDYFFGSFPGKDVNSCKYPAVFASHSHSDHFNQKIFTLADKNPSVRYFLSDDIKAQHQNAAYMKEGDVIREHDIEVYAFGSTDLGVSFAVMCEGLTIFHAGDLNYWSWKKESTQEEIDEACRLYNEKLERISEQFTDFDIAFFPVDPRMQKDYHEGAEIFLQRFNVPHFFPMHFGTRIKAAKDFEKKFGGITNIYAPDKMGQKFIIEM